MDRAVIFGWFLATTPVLAAGTYVTVTDVVYDRSIALG
jgi:hypothetical protein